LLGRGFGLVPVAGRSGSGYLVKALTPPSDFESRPHGNVRNRESARLAGRSADIESRPERTLRSSAQTHNAVLRTHDRSLTKGKGGAMSYLTQYATWGVVILTDSETWAGDVHPSRALRDYRRASGIDARLVVVGMVANEFSIADPSDPGMLDVVGFDTATPQLIWDFARGAL
jgi:hypothetical protein